MSDEDPRSRFSGLRDDYDTDDTGADRNSKQDGNSSINEKSSTDSNASIDGNPSKQGLKARRKSVQAYVPESEKDNLENAWRRIKALCNLADADEPAKNDFYTAALREGYSNLDAIVDYLDLSEPYEEYSDILRR